MHMPMKAIILNEPGGPENFSIQEIAVPQPAPHEVLVQVQALSINPVDIKTRKGGAFYNPLKAQGHVILGWDIAGIVTAAGDGVTKFKVGDPVFGMVNFPGAGLAYAEYVAAPEDHLALRPGNISPAAAAAATLAALTAWQVLVYEANIQPGQHLLVHAAAGGVGHFAVQIARHLGATVTGTASAANAAFLKELGVRQHLDYTRQDMYAALSGVDVVLDPLGGDTTARSLEVLKPGGTLVSIVGGVKDHLQPLIAEKQVQAKNYLVHSSGADMAQMADLLKQGILKPYVSRQFPFEQLAEAHRQVETGHTRGKVIVTLA
jgi:NADPH:quinone reductase-like Zn-dependent oxidoreductase